MRRALLTRGREKGVRRALGTRMSKPRVNLVPRAIHSTMALGTRLPRQKLMQSQSPTIDSDAHKFNMAAGCQLSILSYSIQPHVSKPILRIKTRREQRYACTEGYLYFSYCEIFLCSPPLRREGLEERTSLCTYKHINI